MTNSFFKHFMLPGLNGVLTIVFGLIAIVFPGIALVGLAVMFAVFIMVGGLSLVVNAWRVRKFNERWKFMMAEGLIGLMVGLLILVYPEESAAVFVTIMGIWAILIGIILFAASFALSHFVFQRGLVIISGVLSTLFGLLIMVNPFESTRVIVVLIGIYVIAYGIFSLISTTGMKKS